MGGPFRFEPPAVGEDLLERARLLARMARRWDRRLVTVVAGPGFGKTALLVTAMVSPDPGDEDVWLSCEPSDADADSLLHDLGEALGVADCHDLDDVVAAVWLRAPSRVCIVLDDVHELPPGSAGAAVVAVLVEQLPRNGHVVLASRAEPPLPVASIAARRQLERITEADLLFDASELAAFAAVRGVDVGVLSSSGGWPAVAELAASAGADLVFDYVWDEVLAKLGPTRANHVARLVAAGGGDDEIVAAVVPGVNGVDELVAGVPLVERTGAGWVTLHPLWGPVLRRLLPASEADDCRRRAAAVHRGAGRFDAAIGLLAESQDWDAVVATIRDVEIQPWARSSGPMYGRWCRMLPSAHRQLPAARFAAAIEVAARQPLAATTQFAAAAAGFRAAGDVDGEVAVIFHDGLIRWWANDIAGIAELFERVIALAAGGSAEAATLLHIGEGAIAHINADSPGVLQALAGVDNTLLGPGWSATVDWLRHVALRRAGDLDGAELVLDGAVTADSDEPNTESVLARLQIAWLRGDVERVHAHLPDLELHHRHAGNRYLHVEVSLELAAHLAWLGDRDRAQLLLDETAAAMPDMPGALTKVLRLIAAAGIAVDDGDEALATTLLEDDPHSRPGRPDNWYWRDRAALVLPYVLLPEHREAWDAETVSPTHRVGLDLARALVAARADDLSVVRRLHWPQPGLARAHLPRRWLAELVAARVRAGHPAPAALAVVEPPDHQLTIRVVGPLEILVDGVLVDHPDLCRRRVRELLCLLVARRRARRDVMADVLWPDTGDARHNLRVTLNYLRGMLEPEHARDAPSYFLRADHDTVALHPSAQLHCDVWELAAHLDRADAAERSGDPRGALDAYLAALPMWRGEPYDDIADAEWVRDEQTRWRNRYGRAAIRAGELLLADGNWREAVKAAEYAITADPTTEPAHAVLVRAHLAAGDHPQARRALDACVRALADLDVRPSDATLNLLATAEDGAPLTVR